MAEGFENRQNNDGNPNRKPRQFDGNGNGNGGNQGAGGSNNNRFRNNRRNFRNNRPYNGPKRDNRDNRENGENVVRKQFDRRPENSKPIETAEDIAKDTERLMKEIELEISEIKAIDVSF